MASVHGPLLSASTSTGVEINDTTKSQAVHWSVRSRKTVSDGPQNGSPSIADWHVLVSPKQLRVLKLVSIA
jgi:hypothetical protein